MLLAEFDRSGASAPRFAEMTGIKYQTFIGWLAARRIRAAAKPEVKSPQALTWVEAVAAPPAPAAPVKEPQTEPAAPLRVHLPGGVWMEVAAAEQVRTAALLLREFALTAGGALC